MGQTNSLGYVTQSAINVAGTVSAPLYGVRGYTDPPQVDSKTPHYMDGRRFNQAKTFINTVRGQYTIDLDVAPLNLTPLGESGLGAAVAGVMKAGVGAMKYLTLRYQEGLVQNWQAINQLVNTLELTYSLTDGLQARAQLVGPTPTVTASAWSTVAPIPTGLVPFGAAWQVFLNKGGTVYCVRRMRVLIDNKLDPQYCSPSALPNSTTPAGLTPNTYTGMDSEVTVELEARYDADAASEYLAFRTQAVSTGWQLHAIDPSTGATASVQIDIPEIGWQQGEIQREKDNWQHMTGSAHSTTADGTNLILTVVS
jgi:hypothetical protein